MNSFGKEFIALIKGAVSGEKVHVSDNFDWNEAFELAMRHSIVPFIFYSVDAGVVPSEVMSKFNAVFFQSLAISENQIYYIKELSDAFENEGVDFVLLKGSVLKGMYPSSDMRVMGDADILIKTEQYDKIKPILEKIGFSEQKDCDPEIIWDIKGLHLELHKSLFSKRNSDFYDCFGDGWKNAVLTDGKNHTYVLNPEASLVYLVAHLAKHMRNGGVGVRHVTDIWVYKSKVNVDETVVKKELEKLKLLDFYKNILKTIDVWFNNADCDEVTDFITEWILSGASFGTLDRYYLGAALKKKMETGKKQSKADIFLKFAFPPYSTMCDLYPILKKVKILLPVMYIVRAFSRLLSKRGAVQDCVDKINLSNDDSIDSFRANMEKMGLNYDFINKN